MFDLRLFVAGLLVLSSLAQAAPAHGATTPTPTPLPAVEDCENCLDDDGDGDVDRADSDCAAPSDGAHAGLGDFAATKTLDKCSKALQRAGAKLARAHLEAAAGCLKASATCVQTRPGDAACRTVAADSCAERLGKLAAANGALDTALLKNCSEPGVAVTDLLSAVGIGFSGETEPCGRRAIASLTDLADVSACVQRQHACAIDRVIAATVPRAAELFTLAGRNVATEFPCLAAGVDGEGAAVSEPKRKAIRKCDDAIQRAAQRLVRDRLKTVQSCSAAAFACLEVKGGDAACLAKSQSKCTAAFAKLPGLDTTLKSAIVRSCATAPLEATDLTASDGLGFGALAGRCAAFGTGVASPTDVAGCLVQEVRCRSLQVLENESPRLVELLGAGGQSLAPTATPTPTPPPVPTATSTAPPGFWDATNIPAAQNVMMFKFLNRTNGQYDDAHVFWSVTMNNVTQTHSLAEQPLFDMPAHSSGRIYVHLGSVGKTPTNYYDFLEYTIGPTQFNGNTTRVDAFGIKLAMRLHCADSFEATVGEDPATFAEDRATTFQRFIDAVPAEFEPLAQLQAPYRILNPGWGGFDAGGPYADYYKSYIDQIWATNGLTIPKAGSNGSGLGAYPDLSAAIYRHTAGPNTFAPNGKLLNQSMWANSADFYLQAPADYYAKFWHDNAIDGKAYGFPYDDVGSYSSYISHQNPQYMLVAIGW